MTSIQFSLSEEQLQKLLEPMVDRVVDKALERLKAEQTVAPELDTVAVAKMLGCSEATVRRMIKEGLLPHYRIGRQIRFNREVLEEYARKSSVGGDR